MPSTEQTHLTGTGLADIPLDQPLTPTPAPSARTHAERNRVTGRLREALRLMVYEGMSYDAAGLKAGLTVRTMRLALERPWVIAHLRAQKQVFRASVSAANICKLAELRDKSGNAMAQLGAIKTLEQLDEDQPAGAAPQQRAGMVIVVVKTADVSVDQRKGPQIDLEPGEISDAST